MYYTLVFSLMISSILKFAVPELISPKYGSIFIWQSRVCWSVFPRRSEDVAH
ncbi:hypothetical protein HanPSC8_Chr07g0299281 [Helianthus annuus]|nr:hypothetical protein HanPSC8_Chr07g0299281 [Helianthus annuus]